MSSTEGIGTLSITYSVIKIHRITTMRNIKILFFLPLLIALFTADATSAHGQSKKIINPGTIVPPLSSDYELSPQDRLYLGVGQSFFTFLRKKPFSLQEIAAEIVVIEFFNNYCTSCQAQAPVLNAVQTQIAQNHAIRNKVRFIGVGAGNNSREVERFKAEKRVPFPLIPDPDFALYNAIGDPGGTPFIIIAKKTRSGLTVVSVHMGLIKEAGYFVQRIEEAALTDTSKLISVASAEAEPSEDRVLVLPVSDEILLEKVKASMRASCIGCGQIIEIVRLSLANEIVVYRGEFSSGGAHPILFSQIISRKPVCDVCHGIHFIITFTAEGIIADFTQIHITKYGNVLWNDQDIAHIRQKLVGKSISRNLQFNAEVDAVSTATISSALIFNSVNNLQSVFRELEKGNTH